jgi:hypothetical protein
MVTQEALDLNVAMHQRAFDLLAIQHPGYAYTIHVSEASNKDLGLSAHVKRVNQGTLVSVRADDPTTKTDEEKEAVYLIVAAEGLKTQKEWYVGELDDGEDEVVDVANVSLILGQSAASGVSSTGKSRGIFNKSLDRAQEQLGTTGAILDRQPKHLKNLVGGNTLAHSLVFVFPETPTRNQEQPFRHAVSEMTTTFNTSDDKVGPAWSVVYFLVTNAIGYNEKRGSTSLSQIAPGEEIGLTAEDVSSAIIQGQIDALKTNPTRRSVRSKFELLTALSAQSGDVS